MNKFALIRAALSWDESEIISQHRTEAGAYRALDKLGDAIDYYVAHRKADGEFESRLQARDRLEFINRMEI